MSEQRTLGADDAKPAVAAVNEPVILRGPWLGLGRAVWVLLALASSIILVAMISRFDVLLVSESAAESFAALPRPISYAAFSRLVQLGRYAVLSVYNLTALLIFLRKSDELMGLLTSLLLLLLPFWFDLGGTVPLNCCEPGSPLAWAWFMAILGLLVAAVFFNIFPSGRFPTPWARRIFWFSMFLLGLLLSISVLFGGLVEDWGAWLSGVPLIALLGLGIVGQVYRYFRLSGPVERLQTRWVVASLALAIFWLLAVYSRSPFRSWSPWAGWWALLQIFGTLLVVALLPLSIARAVLRYRLWDIDVIVRKTLSYGLLTGFMLLIYFTGIVVLQGLFSRLTGQNSTLATILSTLLIAALFLPLRRRVQEWIDRRFYRRKYDAARVLEGFAATARDETDLDRLTAELVRVIQETMEPERVTVWLRPTADGRPPTAGEERGGE